jgi:hypothetical protein
MWRKEERKHTKCTSPRTRGTQWREEAKMRLVAIFISSCRAGHTGAIASCRARVDGMTRRGPWPATPALVNVLIHRGTLCRANACGATEWCCCASPADASKRIRFTNTYFLINIKILFKKELKIKKIPMRKRRLHRSTGVWISTALS